MELLFHTTSSFDFMVLLPLGMQFLDLSILTAAHSSFKQLLGLCCSTLKFWWLSLVPCWISFPTPIHMLHSDLRCENHTTSKRMVFTNFRQNILLSLKLNLDYRGSSLRKYFSKMYKSMKSNWKYKLVWNQGYKGKSHNYEWTRLVYHESYEQNQTTIEEVG